MTSHLTLTDLRQCNNFTFPTIPVMNPRRINLTPDSSRAAVFDSYKMADLFFHLQSPIEFGI